MNPKDVEAIVARLVGKAIASVRYFGLPSCEQDHSYRQEPEWWDEAAGGDRSTYGIDIRTTGGDLVSVESESQWPLGLSAHRESVLVRNPSSVLEWDVTEADRWTHLVGMAITAVEVVPSEQITSEYYERLCGRHLLRHWWSWPLGRLWACWTNNTILAVDHDRIPAEHKVSVVASVRIIVADRAIVELHDYCDDILIQFPEM